MRLVAQSSVEGSFEAQLFQSAMRDTFVTFVTGVPVFCGGSLAKLVFQFDV